MPLIRRIPKRGFNNSAFATRYITVNLDSLNRFEEGATVDEAALRSVGLANGRLERIKILGDGELTRKLVIKAHAFSASAREKIQKLGGTCDVIGAKPAEEKPAEAKGKGKGKAKAEVKAEAKDAPAAPAPAKNG